MYANVVYSQAKPYTGRDVLVYLVPRFNHIASLWIANYTNYTRVQRYTISLWRQCTFDRVRV